MSEDIRAVLTELRGSLAPTYEQSPEGRAYLAKIDATLRTHENGGQESGAGAVARVTDEGFIIETGLGIVPGSKLYLAPPSAQAIETAAIMKCVELCRQLDDDPRKDQDYASAGDCIDSLLALIPQDGLTQLRELQKDAERYRTLETLMFIGDVELRQDEDGGYSISLEPVENILAQRWTGNSPEEVVDAVTNLIGVPPLNSETSGGGEEVFRVRGKAVKVGDRVWNDLRGFGVVSGLDARHGRMPIEVNFPHAVEGFANRVYFNDEDELLFWEPPNEIPSMER